MRRYKPSGPRILKLLFYDLRMNLEDSEDNQFQSQMFINAEEKLLKKCSTIIGHLFAEDIRANNIRVSLLLILRKL